MGWRPTVGLEPIASHREEPRRLLEQARYGTASRRIAEGLALDELTIRVAKAARGRS
jgi:hypothetical protein